MAIRVLFLKDFIEPFVSFKKLFAILYLIQRCSSPLRGSCSKNNFRIICHHLGLKVARKHPNTTNKNNGGKIHSLHISFKCHYTSLVYQHIHFVVFTVGILCRQQPLLFCHS